VRALVLKPVRRRVQYFAVGRVFVDVFDSLPVGLEIRPNLIKQFSAGVVTRNSVMAAARARIVLPPWMWTVASDRGQRLSLTTSREHPRRAYAPAIVGGTDHGDAAIGR
jgi:hypothetical protein